MRITFIIYRLTARSNNGLFTLFFGSDDGKMVAFNLRWELKQEEKTEFHASLDNKISSRTVWTKEIMLHK